MTIPTIFTLNNPMLAPILIMIACGFIGFGVAYLVMLLFRKRFTYKVIDIHTRGALRARDAYIVRLNNRVDDLSAENAMLKGQTLAMKIFIKKALSESDKV